MSKKHLKLFGLVAVLLLAAGAAWALAPGVPTNFTAAQQTTITVTNGGTDTRDYALSWTGGGAANFVAADPLTGHLWAPHFFTFNGDGKFTGALWHTSLVAAGDEPLALHLNAGAGANLVLAPRTDANIARGIYSQVYPTAGGAAALFSIIAGGEGRVTLYGGQGNSPRSGVDLVANTPTGYFENTYSGGLYVEKGTAALAHGNAAGYGPIMIGQGATLAVEGTQNIIVGDKSPNSFTLLTQPLVLSYNVAAPATATNAPIYQPSNANAAGNTSYLFTRVSPATANIVGNGRTVSSTFNIADVNGNAQTLDVHSGIRQMAYFPGFASTAGVWVTATGVTRVAAGGIGVGTYPTAAESSNGLGNFWVTTPRVDANNMYVTGTVKGNAGGEIPAYADGMAAAVKLVKTGIGLLNVKAPDSEQQLAVWNNTYRGGTEIRQGTVFFDGATGGVAGDRFKGSAGDTWHRWNLVLDAAGVGAFSKAWPSTAISARSNNNLVDHAPRNNSLSLGTADGDYAAMIVNRDQFFSSFRSDVGSVFTGWKYAIQGVNNLPQITVWLDGSDSLFNGKLTGNSLTASYRPAEFALVLESRHPEKNPSDNDIRFPQLNFPVRANGVRNPAQAFLHLNDPANDVVGNTLIVNGVLAAMGANSIPHAGTDEGTLVKDGRLVIATENFLVAGARGFGTYPLKQPTIVGQYGYIADATGTPVNRTDWYNGLVLTEPDPFTPDRDGTYFLENDRAVYLLKGAGTVYIPNPTTVNDYGSLAAQANTTAQYANATLNGFNDTLRTPTQPMDVTKTWPSTSNYNYAGTTNIEINPRAVFSSPTPEKGIVAGAATREVYPDITNVEDVIVWRDNFPYPVWTGTVALGVSGDVYTFGGNHRSPTNVTIARGTLHLGSYPTGTEPFANIMIRSSSTLSLGEDVNDFANKLNVTFDDDSRIRIVVRESDLMENVRGEKDVYLAPAIFEAQLIEFGPLGTGDANKDRRIVIEVDAKTSGLSTIPAGSWIKAVGATVGNHWNNMHYSGSGTDRDYWKVRVALPGYADQPLDDSDVKVHLNEATHEIFLEFLKDLEPTPDPVMQVDPALAVAASTNPTTVEAGQKVSLYYTVGAEYLAGELKAVGLPDGWTVTVLSGNEDGYNLLVEGIMGSSPVSFYLHGINQSTLKEFKSTQFNVGTTAPTQDSFTNAGFTASPTTITAGGTTTFTAKAWTFTPAGGSAVEVAWDDAGITYGVEAVMNGVILEGAGTDTIVVEANTGLNTGDKVTLGVTATYNGVSGTATGTVTINNGGDDDDGGSSGGCDAGFAGLALLLAIPMFLRKKD